MVDRLKNLLWLSEINETFPDNIPDDSHVNDVNSPPIIKVNFIEYE